MMTRFVLTLLVCFLASFGASALLSDLSAKTLSCKPTSHTTKRCRLNEDWTYNFSEKLNKHGIQKLLVSCGSSHSYGFYNPKKKKIRVSTCWVNKNYSCEAYFKCSEIDNTSSSNYISIPFSEEVSEEEKLIAESLSNRKKDTLYEQDNKTEDDKRACRLASSGNVWWVKEAKRRGLTCGVGESNTQTASSSYKSDDGSPPYMSDDGLCYVAKADGKWNTSDSAKEYVNEAKRRGLSCGVVGESLSSDKKKADEEARKKAEELAAMIKEDEEEEARKAAELVAKKKKEAALLKFKIEKQKEEAEDFYASVIEYVRSSEKADILKWTDQYEKAPRFGKPWNEKDSKAYDDFYNWAFSNIDFETFFKNRADVFQRDRLNKIQNLISKLSAQITDLRKIAKQQFGLPNADSDVTNFISRITNVLSNKDKPNEIDLPGLAELSLSAQKLIESHKASENIKKRLRASLNKLRAKLQEFAKNNFGSAAAKEAVAIVKKIDDALASSTAGETELDKLKAEAGNILEEVEESKNKSSTKTEHRKNEKSDQNKDRSVTKFDAFQNYVTWNSSTDTQKDAFKEKWVGRYVEVTGPIYDVDKMTFSDSHWVILDTSIAEALQGNEMFNIRAMTDLSKTEARKLEVGQEITVRGTVKRIMLGVVTLKDAKILSAPSRNLSSNNSGFTSKTLEWSCNVPLITFGAKGPRMNATFKFNGEDVYVEFSEPMTGKVLNSGPAKPDFVGNVFKLATSGKTVYEVNRMTGSLQVRSSGRIIEASSCSKIR